MQYSALNFVAFLSGGKSKSQLPLEGDIVFLHLVIHMIDCRGTIDEDVTVNRIQQLC